MSDDTRTCPHCGEGFTGGRPEKVYCSRRCKETASAKRKAAREGNDSPGPDTPNGRTCHGCAAALVGKQAKWCSGKCRDRWRFYNEPGFREKVNARNRKNSRKEWAREESRDAKKKKYAERYERVHGPIPDCIHCGQAKTIRKGDYCSRPECQTAQREAQREEAKRNSPECVIDGCTERGFKGRGMCVSHYNKTWRAENQNYVRSFNAMYRVKLRGNRVENVDRDVIMERDSWTCHLCGEKIPETAKYPHPKSASIDHIIPISLGGEHSYRNTAASHLRCNLAKGNRAAGDQLALI